MRYGISGSTKLTVGLASDSDRTDIGTVPLVHGTATGVLSARGRVFWLRSVWGYTSASGLIFGLADCSVNSTAVADGLDHPKLRMTVASCAPVNASNMGGESLSLAKVDFPAPGIKFTTNCCVYLVGIAGALVGGSGATIGAFGGCGYEE